MAGGSRDHRNSYPGYGQIVPKNESSGKLTTSHNYQIRQGDQSGLYQRTSKASIVDKQTGIYARATNKEIVSSGETFKERSTGRIGYKDEYKIISTQRVGDKSGYNEYQLEERFRRIDFGGKGSSNVKDGNNGNINIGPYKIKYGGGSSKNGNYNGGSYYKGVEPVSDGNSTFPLYDHTEESKETDIEGETKDYTDQYCGTEKEHNEGDIDGEEFKGYYTNENTDKDQHVETGEVEQYEEGCNEEECLLGADEDYIDQYNYNDYCECDDFGYVDNDDHTEESKETDIEGETKDYTDQYCGTEKEHNEGDIDGEEFKDYYTNENTDKDQHVETSEVEQYEEGCNEEECLLGADEDYIDQYNDNDYCDDFGYVDNDEDYSYQYSDNDSYY